MAMPKAVRLYQFIDSMQPGDSVTLTKMTEVADADEQTVRSILSRIRNGKVGHPSGGRLPALPIYYDHRTGKYYRTDRLTDDTVSAGVPANMYNHSLAHVLTRVGALRSSFVPGIKKSIEAELISDPNVVLLLQTVGEQALTDLVSDSVTLLRAYSQLRTEQLTRLSAQIPMRALPSTTQ